MSSAEPPVLSEVDAKAITSKLDSLLSAITADNAEAVSTAAAAAVPTPITPAVSAPKPSSSEISQIASSIVSDLGLDLEDDTKKKEQEQALQAAQQKAFFDGYVNAYNLMRFQQMQARRARRLRHHTAAHKKKDASKNKNDQDKDSDATDEADKARFRSKRSSSTQHYKRSHTLTGYPYFSPSTYFQQYYTHPEFAELYSSWFPHNRRHHRKAHHKTQKKKSNKNNDSNMRFRQQNQNAQQRQALAYSNPFNSLQDNTAIHSERIGNSGYGPPMNAPEPSPAMNAQQPILALSTAMFHAPLTPNTVNPTSTTANMNRYRFAQTNTMQQASVPSLAQQVNPSGVPMPFYPPTAPPPPAPNQVPVATQLVNGIFPNQLQIPTSANLPEAVAGVTQPAALNPAGQMMNPNEPNANMNNYPFSSFIQVAEEDNFSQIEFVEPIYV